MTTKEKILLESMKLFSVQGFAAVSVRTIAAAVGVRDSALYKHFKSKQEILDGIVEESKLRFLKKYKELELEKMNFDNVVETCMQMFNFQTQDEWIIMFRRLLLIEQFNNPQMAAIYKALFVEMPVNCQKEIFQNLINQKMMKDKNAEVMAMELYAPFFLYHTIEEPKERMNPLLRKHVENFMEMYMEG
ncbi:TetR/AcrR family transcriptional regulator [Cellulosilyticum sp. ST5]|uniref:TetR/AcrR family transcriptional regulator n=1 Tax=unclassified Cellulosilyticum TaxID=2643091 RepID=UPI000F8C6C69|nr:TetR/AcrR family transcriptional regulator [Cellulosilyticum sp. WCF-2]QEH67810.1 TetR/AcrR family transcriptional regulator [Cellulosilyticum sp. WCF-2]